MMQLLTHSRQDCFKVCRKRHWFAYERGIRPVTDAKQLRMGSAYHDAQEILLNGGAEPFERAIAAVRNRYRAMPPEWNQLEWEYELETVTRLVSGYVWRWQEQRMETVAAEQVFKLPLINPATGQPSRTFQLAGKIDGIVKLEDGRLAVLEHKLLSEDLASDSPLWRRLRIDHQISLYVLAARRLGYDVSTVLYNVTRKPTIMPTLVPILDGDGRKIVLDPNGNRMRTKDGKKFRETGDKEQGYVLQSRLMSADEWGDKLILDITQRHEFYFARLEIPRLDKDLAEYEAEQWDIAKTIRDAQLKGAHYRTCNRETCAWCPYFSLCTEGNDLAVLPEGFEIVSDLNPELGGYFNGDSATNGNGACAAATENATPAAVVTERCGDDAPSPA